MRTYKQRSHLSTYTRVRIQHYICWFWIRQFMALEFLNHHHKQ